MGATSSKEQPEEEETSEHGGLVDQPIEDVDADEPATNIKTNTITQDNHDNIDDDDEEALIGNTTTDIPPSFRLAISERAMNLSLNAIRVGVFCDSVTATILDPNYPFMAIPGAHPDSFDSTGPFGTTAATYFLGMTALLGSAIGSAVIGRISDKIGRKQCLVVCLAVGAIGAVVNYLVRKSFYAFCTTNFLQGLFAATVPVTMAYVSDVKHTCQEKDNEIGVLVGLSMVGTAGGGVATILMEEQGLFTPLFVGAALNVFATVFAISFIIEPSHMKDALEHQKALNDDDDENDEDANAPDEIDRKTMYTIILGSLLDNVGSAGLLPLAMAPLALEQFYLNFLERGENPLMTQSAFKWLSVMVALTVIPGAAFSQHVFDKIGAAGGCIAGNGTNMSVVVFVIILGIHSDKLFGCYLFGNT